MTAGPLGVAASLFKTSGGALQTKTVQAASYATAQNAIQSTIGKLASGAISLAAPFIGSFAADAFGRVLPKSTPPVVREAAKMAVVAVTTAVVKAAAPVAGAVVGAVAGAAVGVGKAIIVGVILFFGVPKGLYFLLAFVVFGGGFEYWRHRCRGSPRFRPSGAIMVCLRR